MKACAPPPHNQFQSGDDCQFVEGWKRITNDPFVLSIIAKGYRLRFTSPTLLLDSVNTRANFPNASEVRNLRNSSRHSRVLFEHIPGSQGIWRVASSYRLKTTEPPHKRSSHRTHAHNKLSAEYRRKRRLCVQNRSAGCVLPCTCTNTFGQQEIPTFCLQKQGIPVSSTSLWSEHCPLGIYPPGTYSGSLPPSSSNIGNSISRQLVDTSPRTPSVTLPPVSVTKHTEHGRPQVKRSKIRTRTSSGYTVSGASITFGSGDRFPPSV